MSPYIGLIPALYTPKNITELIPIMAGQQEINESKFQKVNLSKEIPKLDKYYAYPTQLTFK
jgi:hypothetical protein